jgi:HD superfamily phosphohydrolase
MSLPKQSEVIFTAGQPLPGANDYVILGKDGNVGGAPAEPVGCGGAGVVFRSQYKGLLERAIKFLAPRDDLVPDVDSDNFRGTFDSEISILAAVTHTRIAKITDFGYAPIGDGTSPYYVMEFIKGESLDKLVERDELSGMEFLSVIAQLLDALDYLHGEGIMHSDVKTQNILVRRYGSDVSSTLMDLGVAKVVQPPRGAPANAVVAELNQRVVAHGASAGELEDVTYFVSTPRITRDEWKARLNRTLTREELVEMFPGHDLYAVGVLLRETVGGKLKQRLRRDLSESGLAAVLTIRDGLLAPRESERYRSIAALREDWDKLDPGYLAPLRIPELGVGSSAATSLATPGGRVSISHRTQTLIGHPLFQRLRSIPQLELASLVYPGATHTRFLHSVSTFDMARRFLSHLLNDPAFRLLVSRAEVEATLLWALVHDVGHYPLSHMWEDFAEEELLQAEDPDLPTRARTVPTDDDLMWAFVSPGDVDPAFKSFASVIEDELASRVFPKGPTLAALIEDLFESTTLDALRRLRQPSTLSESVLAGVMTSQIDADKVAYLIDDSRLTGVRYGLGIDVDALLGALRAPLPADVEPGVPTLAIADKGLTAAESVMLARYWMIRRVYWHHANRATIAMTKYVIRRLVQGGLLTPEAYLRETLFATAPEALSMLSIRYQAAASAGAFGSGGARDPLIGLTNGQRLLYKRLVTIPRGPEESDERLYEKLSQRPAASIAGLADEIGAKVQQIVGRSNPVLPGDVILDIPTKRREVARQTTLVYLQRDDAHGRPLESVSPVVGGLKAEFDAHAKKARVYVHPRLMAVLDRAQDSAAKQVLDVLEES